MKQFASSITYALFASVLFSVPGRFVAADETQAVETTSASTSATDAVNADNAVTTASATTELPTHPLEPTLRYAVSNADYIRENVRDYSCRLIKRERIDGELQEYQFANVKVRCGHHRDGRAAEPMSLFIQFLAPAKLKDRRVLYVEGRNDGQILVRKGGFALKTLKLELDPNGSASRRESNYPVTELGFDKIIDRLIRIAMEDIKHDPQATNTEVSHFRGAKVGKRVCTHIQIVHPNSGEGLLFHRANLYVDDELRVPIRLVVYDWPASDSEKPPVLEEYIYHDLRLNIGLTDADFSKSKLD